MTRPYSLAFKQKMLERLTGRDAISARQLSLETGVRQQSPSRWLQEARSLPIVGADDVKSRQWTVQQKARVLAEASGLSGDQLHAYLDREGVRLVDFERWRIALQEDGRDHSGLDKQIPENVIYSISVPARRIPSDGPGRPETGLRWELSSSTRGAWTPRRRRDQPTTTLTLTAGDLGDTFAA
jgi:hypothetical protein